MADEIKIPISFTKSIAMMLGCFVFIFFSGWFIIEPTRFLNWRIKSETTIFIVGIIGLIVFSTFLILIFFKLFEKDKGIVFKKDGFFDNSGGTSAGMIKWEDVIEVSEIETFNQKFVLVTVKNPEYYINKQKSFFKRRVMASNNKFYGSPIQISANALKIKFEELFKLMNEEFEKYQFNNLK